MLKLVNITKVYKLPGQTIQAVNGVSLAFRRNEFVSILGPSGCGKTTMMNIAGGLDQYTSGDLVIDGISTKNYKDAQWDNYRNKRVGFIFQSYNLIAHLSVLGNVEMALTISGITQAERKERARLALERVGLGDQLDKKPNQLSGGQMQRVAIARAIVNEPEILLADEPTGALDTKTSEQIMDIIQEIAKDKLVIMVTHNPELAERYSTRLIRMKDGEIVDDSMPYDGQSHAAQSTQTPQDAPKTPQDKSTGKTSMSFLTALGLSQRNLRTKKKRSIMISIASAIGILGIGLILALSSGLNAYIDGITRSQVESTPITISQGSYVPQNAGATIQNLTPYPSVQKMFIEETLRPRETVSVPSDLKQLFEDSTSQYYLDESWYNDILYQDGMDVSLYARSSLGSYVKMTPSSASLLGGSSIQQMQRPEFVAKQYDILNIGGKLPTTAQELALVVDESNAISDATLMSLGLKTIGDGKTEYTFEELCDMEFKLVSNHELYTQNGEAFDTKAIANIDFDDASNPHILTAKISAVLRLKENVDAGILAVGFAYPIEVVDWLKAENLSSPIVTWMQQNPTLNPHEGTPYEDIVTSGGFFTSIHKKEAQQEAEFRKLGGATYANEISIYATNLEGKDSIKAVLERYNADKSETERIYYVDFVEMIGDMLSSLVNVVSWVLIGFTAISLLVSAVMISIITSISVMERTKEIGILRAIGARKKDVTRLFNAENVILGGLSGVIGVLVTLLLSVPINMILSILAGINGIAVLSWWHMLILLGISTGVAFISGYLPAQRAAQKDPVLALRTE